MKLGFDESSTLHTLDLSKCASLVAVSSDIDRLDLTVLGADDVPRFAKGARIWDTLKKRSCHACGRQHGLDVPRLRVCGRCVGGRCNVARYCGVECQRAHWEWHRKPCRWGTGTCDVCHSISGETDPPYPTCHCGKRCYCGEACQAQDWAAGHAGKCKSGYLHLEGS